MFRIEGFGPTWNLTEDGRMAVWSFTIELDYALAVRCHEQAMRPAALQRLHELGVAQHENVFQDWKPKNNLFPRRRIFSFWDDRCLLTNLTVEPGNACGLDLDHGDYQSVQRRCVQHTPVRYLPHNVDSQRQATALLASWLLWYNHIESLCSYPASANAIVQ